MSHRIEVVAEARVGWSISIPDLPVAADGATRDDAVADMIDTLREYADDWQQRLSDAPTHRDHWGVVRLIKLSDDDQLRQWLLSSGR